MLYLCGLNAPDSTLVVRGDGSASLYLVPGDAHSDLWDGPRTPPECAASVFGVQEVRTFIQAAD